MKKLLVSILVLALSAGVFSACDSKNNAGTSESSETEETEEDEPSYSIPHDKSPHHDLNNVDQTMRFEDFVAPDFTEPWFKEKEVPLAYGNVKAYFSVYMLDRYDDQIPAQNLNTVSTITKPSITMYADSQEGYVIYEVTYTEIFPINVCSEINTTNCTWRYHGVRFMDYYTGIKYPSIEMDSGTDSFHVYGNVIYNGETYPVHYYEFREEEIKEETTDYVDGLYYWSYTDAITHTAYFVVPEGYNGIVMYVYVADDSDMSYEDALKEDHPIFMEPGPFGTAYDGKPEIIDDYAFYSIVGPR